MEILKEENYKLFKFIKGNRPIVEGKVKKLVEVVTSGLNLFEYCPVLVNSEMYVIDGQHRLTACRQMKLPVFYCVVPNITLNQIAKLNTGQNKWSIEDFFNLFIETGNTEYKTLKLFKERYGIATNIAAQLLMFGTVNSTGGGGHNMSEIFREGGFKVSKLEVAEKLLRCVNDYDKIATHTILKNRNFIRAIQELIKSKYPHDEVVEKLTRRNSILTVRNSWKDYIYLIEEFYNRGNNTRVILYGNKDSSKKSD
jgi:hypothetical protein